MKIRPLEAEFFHADGWLDRQANMTELIAAFRNFAKAPKKVILLLYLIYYINVVCQCLVSIL